MTSITTLQNDKIITFLRQKRDFKVILSYDIHALVLLNLLHLLGKRDKMLGKPRILFLFLSSFNIFNKT